MTLPPEFSIELFTELVPRRSADVNESPCWWHFIISSFDAGQSIKHASGDVGFVSSHEVIEISPPVVVEEPEQQHNRIWYSRF